jgi:hypothetical protein
MSVAPFDTTKTAISSLVFVVVIVATDVVPEPELPPVDTPSMVRLFPVPLAMTELQPVPPWRPNARLHESANAGEFAAKTIEARAIKNVKSLGIVCSFNEWNTRYAT